MMALKMLGFFVAISWFAWILFFMGIGQRRDSRLRDEREATRTTGTIVDYVQKEQKTGRRGGYLYWKPVVEYTADGQRFRAEYENRMDPDQHPVGKTVDICYDVSEPSHFHLSEDPVFTDPGGGAIRIALIWVLASAVLTVLLAVFVGDLRLDFNRPWHQIRLFFRRLGG